MEFRHDEPKRWAPLRNGLIFVAVLASGLSVIGLTLAANPNERVVKPAPNVQDIDQIYDKDGNPKTDSKVWVLDFKFKDPRLIKVDVPGRGQKVCWYLWYQVINKTKEAHTFYPDFELVANEKHTVYRDQVLPKVQDSILKIEDPTGYLNIKNSVTISAEPIPPSRPNAMPKAVTGVAIWDNVDPDTNSFSIYVAGLSNGYALTDNPLGADKEPIIRRKTLQLNFKKLGDRYNMTSDEIHFVGPYQWIYRATQLSAASLTPAKPAEKAK